MKHFSRSLKALIAGSLLSASSTVLAEVEVLTFDEFANGQIIDDEYYSEFGVSISAENRDEDFDFAVAFNSMLSNTEDPDLEYGNLINDYEPLVIDGIEVVATPGNVLIIQENDDGCDSLASNTVCSTPDDEGSRPAGYFTFTFDDPVTILGLDFFDVEDQSDNGINPTDHPEYYTIYFYDSGNNVLGTEQVPLMLDSEWERVTYNIANVAWFELNLPGSGAIDNLVFDTTEVSAPQGAGILGLGLLGLYLRRRYTA